MLSELSNPNLFPSSLLFFTTLEKLNSKSSGINNVASSLMSFPDIASSVFATISTFFPIGPAVSWEDEIGIIPDLLTSPVVGFIPTIPFIEDGQEIDPFVSVPIAISTNPWATATAEPELDPQGLYSSLKKCLVWPPKLDQPLTEFSDLKFAHSDRLAFPNIK